MTFSTSVLTGDKRQILQIKKKCEKQLKAHFKSDVWQNLISFQELDESSVSIQTFANSHVTSF